MRSHPMCASMRPTDEGRRQIPASSLAADPKALPEIIGPWTRDLEALSRGFANSGDVPHVVIDGFFSKTFAQALSAAFPSPDAPDIWHLYDNPLERKRACSDVARMPAVLRDAVCALCGPSMVEAVRRITGLEHASALQADPHCHGGGLHSHGTGDKLDLHLDYSLHPISGLERRFNLIVYLVPEPWPSSYGGALELRGAAQQSASEGVEAGELSASVLPAFNRAVLFSTTAPSFHGFPAPLCCPADARRNSVALYYLTPPRPDAPKRSKALYVPTPGEPHSEELTRLRTIRSERRLCAEDVTDVALDLAAERLALAS